MRPPVRLCILLLSLLSIAFTNSYAQKDDSLKRVLRADLTDSARQRVLLGLTKYYNTRSHDSCIRYGNQLVTYATTHGNKYLCAEAHNSMGYADYMKGDYNASMNNYRNMYRMAESLHDVKNMGYALNNEANVNIEKGALTEAIKNYKLCLKLSEDNKDETGIAMAYNNMAYVNKEQGNYEQAIEGYVGVLKTYERMGNEENFAQCYDNMAFVYEMQRDYAKAMSYCEKAIVLQQKYKHDVGLGISYNIIASIYGDQQKDDLAVVYFGKARAIYNSTKDVRQEAVAYANMGEVYARARQYDSAVASYKQSVAINTRIGNNRSLPHDYVGLSGALISMGKYDEAHAMLDSANRLLKITPKKETTKLYLNILSDYYSAVGKNKESLEAYKEFVLVKDSLLNEQNAKNITEISTRYETEKKELKIENLNREGAIKDLTIQNQQLSLDRRLYELAKKALQLSDANLKIAKGDLVVNNQQRVILRNQLDSAKAREDIERLGEQTRLQQLTLENQRLMIVKRNAVLAISLITFALVLLWLYTTYKRNKLKQQALMQQQLMRQQEAAAREIITAEENERKRIASDLHDGVGQIMSAAKMNLSAIQNQLQFASEDQRLFFESAIKMVDDGCKEVRVISHNMMPNALLKAGLATAIREFVNMIPDKVLHVQLHAEGLGDSMDKGTENVLYRVVQECVQNVIKHAGATNLDISLIKDEVGIDIMVEDNGKGFDTATIGAKDGLGTGNMMKRISYLKGTIEWSSSPSNGTVVSIHVPLG